jgi:polysaccharide deacetylase family protein (PEP-CTERM system associated)
MHSSIMLNALTIDVEDYFHVAAFAHQIQPENWGRYPSRVEKNTNRLLDLLSEQQVRATFFILGWVADECPALVRKINKAGHAIGCHGYFHQMIYEGSPSHFRCDLRRAKGTIEDVLGRSIKSYRAPSYSVTSKTPWALPILAEEGFEYDSSIFPIMHDLYGVPGAPRFPYLKVLNNGQTIKEFPPSTIRLLGINCPIGGGGYLRILPYSVTSLAIHRINAVEKQPAMVYLHPWEIDPDQPRISAPWMSRFRHYHNLDTTELKFKKLLREFSFCTLESVLDGRTLEPPFEGSAINYPVTTSTAP